MVEETEKTKPKQKKKTGNNSLCQVDSFTKDAGSKEGSKIIFLKKIENTEAISTIKFYSSRKCQKIKSSKYQILFQKKYRRLCC